MLAKIRTYYAADIREQVASEIEAEARRGAHASDEPVFVDAAYVARHGSLSTRDTPPGSSDG